MLTFLYYRSMCISIYNAKSARPVPDAEMFTLSVQRLVYSSRSLVSVSRFHMLSHSIRSSNTSLGSDNPNWDITVVVTLWLGVAVVIFVMKFSIITLLQSARVLSTND